MPPVRRHIRLTVHSALEVRIYLDPPSPPNLWLLKPTDSALPRIVADIKPLILTRVREIQQAAHGPPAKGKKKKALKDTVSGDDYTVSIFFTPLGTDYALLVRSKRAEQQSFYDGSGPGTQTADPIVLTEHHDDGVDMIEIPEAIDVDVDDDLDNTSGGATTTAAPNPTARATRRKRRASTDVEMADGTITVDVEPADDKKELTIKTNYDGLRVFEKALVLIVKRTGTTAPKAKPTSTKIMENWVESTQAPREADED